MLKPGLKDQLQLYWQLRVPDIPKISSIPNKPEMYSALLAAVQWYKSQPQNTLQPSDHNNLQCAADEGSPSVCITLQFNMSPVELVASLDSGYTVSKA